ncbi:alpha/beta hydrolase fold domain-containing protein [Lyngbya aestuarii]|uniref:alpha/beta hydrolase fold domain-containing protein n=1 Tax=Lyngbya aestuarii TaxID=118322 RepID=UPI00403DE3F2
MLIPLLLSAVGLFLSLWIVVPAPTLFLLPLGVGAPEISPWLVCLNAIALMLVSLRWSEGWLCNVTLVCSLLALLLSLLPLIQFSTANAGIANEMQTVLGEDYLAKVPPSAQMPMRSQPFVLIDAFRGIPLEEVRIERGIVFANPDGVALKLNIYRPLSTGKYPTIVMIYGGAWRTGTPDNDEKFSRYMAARGYSVVAIDYRHAPEYRFPAQLEDIQTALSYIQTHAEELEVDIKRMALLGRSAGAQLAAIAAYQPDAVPVRAVVNYYGPVNLTNGYYNPPFPDPIDSRAVLRAFLGGTPEELAEIYRKASPISYVRPDLPPSLLVYAGCDHLVQAKFGRRLYEQLQTTENLAVWLEIPWAEHAFDAVFNGVSNQLALYYTERFLAWALQS